MHEILENLAPGQRVLDLGSGSGSFASSIGPFIAIRADLDQPSRPAPNLARADAARLPFPDRAFDAVISNHSLEHFHDLAGSLAEIGRVLKPTGALYIAVPDASTFSDRLYRLLARGGGHVNPFTSAPELARDIERATHLRHVDTRTLCTSFCYLNRSNPRICGPTAFSAGGRRHRNFAASVHLSRAPLGSVLWHPARRLRLGALLWKLRRSSGHRCLDQCVHPLRLRRAIGVAAQLEPGAPAFPDEVYRCPNCGTTNHFFEDRRFPHLEAQSPVPNP